MDAQRTIEDLTAIEGRWGGSDAERRAARYLEQQLGELGREARSEPTRVRPNFPVTHVIHALLAIAGSVVSVEVPLVGAALVLLAAVSTFGDLTGTFQLVRRLTAGRASQNVVSEESSDRPGTLVLVAHYDAGRTGAVHGPRVTERRAVLGKLIRRPIGGWSIFFWSLIGVMVCCLLRVIGLEPMLLTVIQFLFTVVLISSVPLLADIALSGAVPGANDNASGVATVLRLAERYGGDLDHFDVWVVFTGAQESFMLGMKAFLKAHRHELPRERTIFLNVDQVGHGTVRWAAKDGLIFGQRFHPTLLRLCEQIAEEDEEEDRYGARSFVSRSASDAHAARSAGYPSISISTLNALDYAPHHHLPGDVPERIDEEALERAFRFCSELIELLDEEVGPDLSAEHDETVLAEEEDASV